MGRLSKIIRLTQDVKVHPGTGVDKGDYLLKGTLMRETNYSKPDNMRYSEQPDGWGYSRPIPDGVWEPVNPLEPRHNDFQWLFDAMCRGAFPLPSFTPVFSDDAPGMTKLISNVASGGSSNATGVAHVHLPGTDRTRWARLFPWFTQRGAMDGRGYILLYDTSYGRGRVPIGGTYTLCEHEYNDQSTQYMKQRGDHRGYCTKCGLNMSVDSSD